MAGFKSGLKLAVLTQLLSLLAPTIQAKNVFCHYLVGTVDADHVASDVDAAQAAGFDAFALDILDVTASYTASTTASLFDYAASKGFKLFFSMDLGADPDLPGFQSLVQQYLGNPAYFTYNNLPFLSTYSAAGYGPSDFTSFLQSLGQQVYFVPDLDNTQGYYTDADGWNYAWDEVVQGAFSWETAWPADASAPVNESVSQDMTVQTSLHNNGKTYMMPLSTLQYKHLINEQGCSSIDANYYRIGEVNMPERMSDILSLSDAPDFVEVITWNDAGEGHYIGGIWPEGLPQCILDYANGDDWDHSGWQPIFQSFIAAYKAGGDATTMTPQNGASAVGAMWYRTILKDASCSGDPLGKPDGWEGALDAVNYAVVLPSDPAGMQIQVVSGGTVLQTITGQPGLNYGSVPGLATGSQQLVLLDSNSNPVMTANGGMDVAADTDGICNFNYQVAGLQ